MKTPDVKRECNIIINGKTVEGEKFSNVPMNSPECIKKKLESYSARYLSGNNWGREVLGTGEIMHNAFFLVLQLESDNESKQKRIDELTTKLSQAERDRDAAVAGWKRSCLKGEAMCRTCKFCEDGSPCLSPTPCEDGEHWEWRGPCPENTKEE